MKFWDKERVKRVRNRQRQKEDRAYEKARAADIAKRTYSAGAHEKNAALMLDALGNSDRRHMVGMLQRGGAMSLSKLAKPFKLKLPTAHAYIKILERAGIVTTHKRGRVRICVYKAPAIKELSSWLASQSHISNPAAHRDS